ncbi:MAG: hypothetical protein LBB58_05350 [Cellulomonadaceae bacterium]|jgi:hypothetical protein|nr:hypothetical protein [Cellulomonadaceae bacterium]
MRLLSAAHAALNFAVEIPELTDEQQLEQIRINFQALLIVLVFAIIAVLAIFLINRWAGKRRYAAHQATLLAQGRAGRSSALSDVANNRPIVTDDAGVVPIAEGHRASIFGENYRSVDMSGSD